jgi:hypothetical protein
VVQNLPIELPPGIVKVDSPNAAKGRYVDCDKVRFEKGLPEKWLGWEKFIDDQLDGIARGATSWTNIYGNINVAIGTNTKLYAIVGNDSLTDITPIRATGTLGTDPITTTDGETEVTIADTAHGVLIGDTVNLTGADAVGGITIDGDYLVTSVPSANAYTIEHSSAATSDATGGGASAVYSYRLNIGNVGTIAGLGWSAGPWGDGTWSTPRTEGLAIELRVWSLSEYGNDLMASPSNGGLYLWQQATDTEAEIVTNAPTAIRSMFITGERFVIALGTLTPMTIQWPDRDDITDWTPSTANTANIRALQQGSKLVAGTSLVEATNLIWTDKAIYVMQYTGSDLIYDTRLAGTECGLIAPLGYVTVSGAAYWISGHEFYMYSGGVQRVPNQSDVSDWVFSDMDPEQIEKTWAEYDPVGRQVRWHYCSAGSEEPDKYVDVDLDDYAWTTGTEDRTTGCTYRPERASSLRVSSDGYVYEHNVGLDADGAAMESFITYGEYVLTRGETNVDVMGLIPDFQRQSGNLSVEVFTKERPNSASVLDTQTVTIEEGTEIEDLRVEGRHFSMKITSNVIGGDFRLGIVSLEIGSSGNRR